MTNEELKSMFQFYIVRLKEVKKIGSNLFQMFQFYIVRLKERGDLCPLCA